MLHVPYGGTNILIQQTNKVIFCGHLKIIKFKEMSWFEMIFKVQKGQQKITLDNIDNKINEKKSMKILQATASGRVSEGIAVNH